MSISIAMIGVGPMGALHAQVLTVLPGVRVVSCASRDLAKAQAFAARFGIPNARLIDDVAIDPQADALWIVAPCDAMAGLAARFATLGLPMFLEKPVGLSAAETAAVAQVVTVPNMVGLNRRFYGVIGRARDMVAQAGGVRGVEVHMPEDLSRPTPTHAAITRRQWQFANSVHLVDLFRFFGGEVARVTTDNVVKDEADRSYNALLAFENGARGLYNAQWYAPGGWRVAVYGDGVAAVLQPLEKPTFLRRGQQPELIEATGADASFKPGLYGQAEAFAQLVLTGIRHPAAADLAEYARSVALVEQLTVGG